MNVFLLVGVVACVAVAHANMCVNQDPSTCSVMCGATEAKACEHEICTCAPKCTQLSDCRPCDPIHTPDGHTIHQSEHCVDGACVCQPDHMPHPGGNHHGGQQ